LDPIFQADAIILRARYRWQAPAARTPASVFDEAAIAHLAIAELAFDDPEHVLDFGAYLAEPGDCWAPLRRQLVSGRAFSFTPQTPACFGGRFLDAAGIPLSPTPRCRQCGSDGASPWHREHCMVRPPCAQAHFGINADMRLHAELPLITLLRGPHLGSRWPAAVLVEGEAAIRSRPRSCRRAATRRVTSRCSATRFEHRLRHACASADAESSRSSSHRGSRSLWPSSRFAEHAHRLACRKALLRNPDRTGCTTAAAIDAQHHCNRKRPTTALRADLSDVGSMIALATTTHHRRQSAKEHITLGALLLLAKSSDAKLSCRPSRHLRINSASGATFRQLIRGSLINGASELDR